VTRLMLKDELLDAQLLRVVGASVYGGSDVGECLGAARRVRGVDLESWHEAWLGTAEIVAGVAERDAAAGRASPLPRTVLRLARQPPASPTRCDRVISAGTSWSAKHSALKNFSSTLISPPKGANLQSFGRREYPLGAFHQA